MRAAAGILLHDWYPWADVCGGLERSWFLTRGRGTRLDVCPGWTLRTLLARHALEMSTVFVCVLTSGHVTAVISMFGSSRR